MILAGHDYNEKQDDFDHDCLQYQLFSNSIHGHGGVIDVVYKIRYKYTLISYETVQPKDGKYNNKDNSFWIQSLLKISHLNKKDSNVLFMLYLMMTL